MDHGRKSTARTYETADGRWSSGGPRSKIHCAHFIGCRRNPRGFSSRFVGLRPIATAEERRQESLRVERAQERMPNFASIRENCRPTLTLEYSFIRPGL